MTSTIKHNITKKEYENGTFAICTVDASHYLILEDGRDFLLGDDWDSLFYTEDDYKNGKGFEKETVSVTDANGLKDDYEAYTIPVKDANFGIDLEDFNNGTISWL